MSNRNEHLITLLRDAIADLERSKAVLADAKATPNPILRAQKLRAAITRHEETREALKQAKFTYVNGAKKIDDKFKFRFHRIIEQEPIDKRLVLVDAIEDISECDAECLAALVEAIFAVTLAVIVVELTAEIRRVVGDAFSPTNLTLAQLTYCSRTAIGHHCAIARVWR